MYTSITTETTSMPVIPLNHRTATYRQMNRAKMKIKNREKKEADQHADPLWLVLSMIMTVMRKEAVK